MNCEFILFEILFEFFKSNGNSRFIFESLYSELRSKDLSQVFTNISQFI